jgi:hypothetical protein
MIAPQSARLEITLIAHYRSHLDEETGPHQECHLNVAALLGLVRSLPRALLGLTLAITGGIALGSRMRLDVQSVTLTCLGTHRSDDDSERV